MILVCVGTTSFDELIEAVDAQSEDLGGDIVFQTGKGTYVPKNGTHFAFDPKLAGRMKDAELAICHGGAGVLFEALRAGCKVVGVENPHMQGRHQRELLGALEAEGSIVWCREMSQLARCAEQAVRLGPYSPPKSALARDVAAELGVARGRGR